MSTDKELVEGILNGSEKLLRVFYQTYKPKVTNFVRQRISNEKDVEEITQDVFLATIEGFRDFTYRSSIYTYMCAIAKRKAIDFYRKKKLKRIVFSQIPAIESLVALLTTPEDTLDERLLEQKIAATFTRLSPRYRMILHMKYVKDYSVDRIAHELSVSFKSAESLLFRARKAFMHVYATT